MVKITAFYKVTLSPKLSKTVMPTVVQATPPLTHCVMGIKVAASGMAMGSKVMANEDLGKLGYDSKWIIQRTGIKSRCHAAEGEATSDFAIRSGKKCLEEGNVSPTDVDLIIVATMTPDHLCPSTACLVQHALGCDNAAAIDVNAACSGFMYALIMASQFVKTGCSRNALVIGAETLTVIMDPQDVKTYPLFGDGAGAVLLTADGNAADPTKDGTADDSTSGILSYKLASDGSMGDALIVPACGSRLPASTTAIEGRQQFLKMDGRTVFKWAVRVLPKIVNETLALADMSIEDVDLFIPHQANTRIINAAVEDMGLDPAKAFINLDRYGNTSAASIPVAIVEALDQGRIQSGDNVLMVGFGGGLTWGSCLFRW